MDPRNLFARCRWQADKILKTVKDGRHRSGQREVWDFPFLRGEKIGPLWLRMLRDNVGLSLDNMDRIPIPVDIHVARSTLALGVVRGSYAGNLSGLFKDIREAWFRAVKGLKRDDGSDLMLWTLMNPSGTCPNTVVPAGMKKVFALPGRDAPARISAYRV